MLLCGIGLIRGQCRYTAKGYIMSVQSNKVDRSWSWISFMFSAFYFISLLYSPFDLARTIKALMIYGVFALLYVRLQNCSAQQAKWFILGITLLGFFGVIINPTANVFFGYATFYSGFYLTRKKSIISSLAIIACLFASAKIFNVWHLYNILPGLIPAISLAFLGVIIRQGEQQKVRDKKNEEEKHQLIAVAERERIARDLHDTLGHTLSSISLKSQLAKKLGDSGDMENALKEIDHVASIASTALSEVRQVVSGYRVTDIHGRLRKLKNQLEESGFATHFNISLPELPPKHEAALILIITEAVTNILRHSSGRNIDMTSILSNGHLKLMISNDGTVANCEYGNGLTGIQERVDDMSGTMEINADSGFKLSISLELPLPISPLSEPLS